MTITHKLLELLGKGTVLLRIPKGEKGPRIKGWQNMTSLEMTVPYLAELDSEKYNIGVLLGPSSNNLCSIDIDDDESMKPFLQANPLLKDSLMTRGKRGLNIWVRITGDYPSSHKIVICDGGDWGEWRAKGNQTVIHGQHPDGMPYQILKRAKPVEIRFDEINWPENLVLPWVKRDDGIEHGDTIDKLLEDHGMPITVNNRGTVSLNQGSIASIFTQVHRVLYEADEKAFYIYRVETGLWSRVEPVVIAGMVETLARNLMQDMHGSEQLNKITANVVDSIIKLVRPKILSNGEFHHTRSLIHLKNGVLDLDTKDWNLMSFSDEFYSRNQVSVDWVEGAVCPRFVNELLRPCLSEEDIDLLQRVIGSLLLSTNRAQVMTLLIGTAGSGKSTLIKIIERLIGPNNIASLRTKQLDSNFELQFFIGKRLLLGLDVSRRFLRESSADKIKALIGGDRLAVEKKYSSESLFVQGNYHMLLTGNAVPLLNLDGDSEAWRRRIILIEWKAAKLSQRIPNFDQILFDEEGPGILNWALQGLERHLDELAQHGRFVLTEKQSQRVENLLNASDSVRAFVYSELESTDGVHISMSQMRDAYTNFCQKMQWEPFEKRSYKEALEGTILERFDITESHDVEVNGKSARGYRNLNLVLK